MTNTFTIVLVDDDQDEHIIFKDAIHNLPQKDSIKLICFDNGEKILKSIQKIDLLPSVIFLDINMPYLNGFETLSQLRKTETYKSTPMIIYSTSQHPNDINKAYAYGANLFMTKTVSINELSDRIHQIMNCIRKNQPMNVKDFISTAF